MTSSPRMELDELLRDKVRLLGTLLGNTIEKQCGADMLQCIETIRKQAKIARNGDAAERERLIELLKQLKDDELVPVARGFNQFLNFANLAEQQHGVSWRRQQALADSVEGTVEPLFSRLDQATLANVGEHLAQLSIEVVLTAHPTEITRRTLIQKYDYIAKLLQERDDLRDDHPGLPQWEQRLAAIIEEIWCTDEIRQVRPTAVDEAKWGFTVIENSLWFAVPQLVRELDQALLAHNLPRLPLLVAPVRFASWMGGDRDGNPNVTAKVTHEVLHLARWMSADLYLRDLDVLIVQLSMPNASDELLMKVGNVAEPYRACLQPLRQQLQATRRWAAARAQGESSTDQPLLNLDELSEPLLLCYRSLCEQGLQSVADTHLLDTLRRVACFGLTLGRLDVRQESSRHSQVISDITEHYGWGRYDNWEESRKQAFLESELSSGRPLVPMHWQPSAETQEVLDTLEVLASDVGSGVSCYIISMASEPSDVLEVALLLQSMNVKQALPIVPLFETLDDLEQSARRMQQLWSIPWYRQYCQGRQQVMIGYSDSSKDAGQLAAVWAQYRAQEALVNAAHHHDIALCLFHGRGGSIGRGGGPAQRAILAQPPGSVAGGFRVTEQGEMIRFKFGQPAVALRSLQVYVAAVLEANLLPPAAPELAWRERMQRLAEMGVQSYRAMVRGNADFVPYFQAATPEQELGKLALGSRPARRKQNGGIESLRAIPWIFAWTQMRLMLPAWLGSDEALQTALDEGAQEELRHMYQHWPFFKTYIDMLEMVISKAEPSIAQYYEDRLVPDALKPLGQTLRTRLERMRTVVLRIQQQTHLLENHQALQRSMQVRNPYTDPLHYLQAELLYRNRQSGGGANHALEQALKVTMAGIAAGMRNTG